MYFEEILQQDLGQEPIIFLKDLNFEILKAMIEFMYCGETTIDQHCLPSLSAAAKTFKVKELASVINIVMSSKRSEELNHNTNVEEDLCEKGTLNDSLSETNCIQLKYDNTDMNNLSLLSDCNNSDIDEIENQSLENSITIHNTDQEVEHTLYEEAPSVTLNEECINATPLISDSNNVREDEQSAISTHCKILMNVKQHYHDLAIKILIKVWPNILAMIQMFLIIQKENIAKSVFDTPKAENRSCAKPTLRRSMRLNQQENEDSSHVNLSVSQCVAAEKNLKKSIPPYRTELYIKGKRKAKDTDRKVPEQHDNNFNHPTKRSLNGTRTHKNASKLIAKRSTKSASCASKYRDEHKARSNNKLKSDTSGKVEAPIPKRNEDTMDLSEYTPDTEIPFAVGLLPLRTALEKMQATPDYQPRKTRSSVAPMKQEVNGLKRKSCTALNQSCTVAIYKEPEKVCV
ncbi:hypothetical protein KM043_011094 [Ampulex compressa]|nr:hypothetical protein KM043_011094 [Ampulex compressa]